MNPKKRNSIFLLLLTCLLACQYDSEIQKKTIDLTSIKIFGDLDVLGYPPDLKANMNTYAQIPVRAINFFKGRMEFLQYGNQKLNEAVELDSMIITRPDKIQTTSSDYKAYFWPEESEYYQITDVNEVYYFDYFHHCCWFTLETESGWQLADFSQGYMEGSYVTGYISYYWKNNDQEVSFAYNCGNEDTYDRYNVSINKKDFSGSLTQSLYHRLINEVTWNSSGHGAWVHHYEDGSTETGIF